MVEEKKEKTSDNEKVYYDDGYNKITSKRFVLGVNTYILSNIASVTIGTDNYAGDPGVDNPKRAAARTAGGGLLLVGLVMFFMDSMLWCILCVGLGGASLYYAMQMEATVGATSDWAEYGVTIHSNAGESDGVQSEDEEKINKLADAMNTAIIEDL